MAVSSPRLPADQRKTFRRTRIPLAERVAALVILALLGGIGVGIWQKGKHFDPGQYALRTEALASTAENVEGKAGTLRGEVPAARGAARIAAAAAEDGTAAETEGYETRAVSGEPAAGQPAQKGGPLLPLVAGIEPMGDTEFYSAGNLYEKIDGRAPAYLNFNFQGLRCRSFAVPGATGSFVDVYEFEFDSPVNAFGMFSSERDAKGAPTDFAPDGYAGELGFYFRQGTHYVQVIGSDQKPGTLALAKAIAQDRAKNLPANNAGLDARKRLPATGLEPASVQFLAENALGQEFLKNVYQGSYAFGGKTLQFFVMIARPEEASAAWQSFADFSGRFGGKRTPLPDVNGAKLFQGESFGRSRVIYQREGEIGGVVDAEDGASARQFVEQYLAGKIR